MKLKRKKKMFPNVLNSEPGPNVAEVHDALDTCLSVEEFGRQEWIKGRIDRMADLLGAFGNGLNRGVYDAMCLYEASSAFNVLNQPQRLDLITNYLTLPDLTKGESEYVMSLLGDLNYLDDEANSYRSHPNVYPTVNIADKERLKKIISDNYDQEIKIEDWSLQGRELNVHRIQEVTDQTNLESIVIKASQLLDDLIHSDGRSDVELFHKVNEAKLFYAPIGEMLGYSGMASSLRDYALRIKYHKLGEDKALERATQLHQDASKIKIDDVLALINPAVDESSTKFYAEQTAGLLSNGSKLVDVGDLLIELPHSSGLKYGYYRYKTIGSLTDKIVKKEVYRQELPSDMIALNFVFRDEEELKANFITTVRRLIGSEQINFKPTPQKTSPFFVQATEERVRGLDEGLRQHGIAAACEVVEASRFQVAKMTFEMKNVEQKPVGVEIQFLTEADRSLAQRGWASHLAYKLTSNKQILESDIPILVKFMDQLHRRRTHMESSSGSVTIKPESLVRAERLFADLVL